MNKNLSPIESLILAGTPYVTATGDFVLQTGKAVSLADMVNAHNKGLIVLNEVGPLDYGRRRTTYSIR